MQRPVPCSTIMQISEVIYNNSYKENALDVRYPFS